MMDHEKFALLLDTPETEWTPDEKRAMEEHAASCADCAMLLAMRREMRAMDEEAAVPVSFSSSWRDEIQKEERTMNGKILQFPWKRTLAGVAAAAVVLVGTTATFLSNRDTTSVKQNTSSAYYDTYIEEESYDGGNYAAKSAGGMAMNAAFTTAATAEYEMDAAPTAEGVREAKIIRTVDLTIKTKEYQADYEALRELTARLGGRVESLSTSGDGTANSLRRATFTLRIPSDRLDEFISGARGVGSVSSYSENSQDVSDSYYDMQTRLDTQRAKLQRLTELMAKAEDVSDLIELEDAISDTQYWIDYYTGQMNGYDSRVSDSTVYVKLQELSTAEPVEVRGQTLGERIQSALAESLELVGEFLQAMVVFLVAALPWIAGAAVILLGIRALVRHHKKVKRAKENQQ